MATEPLRFKQITTGGTRLFGLEDGGAVWEYDTATKGWLPVPMINLSGEGGAQRALSPGQR
jgi:hypothetical protein